MKNIIINSLKITIPLLLGVYVGWYFWDQFSDSERKQFYGIFNRADYFILVLSLLVGFLSHLARAKRWLYALKPMGYQPSLWRSYHAIMVGYIMNIIFPRLGEASRAGVLLKTDNIPFQKSFGSIVSERILDMLCLVLVGGTALLINMDQISDLLDVAKNMSPASSSSDSVSVGKWISYVILITILITIIGVVFLYFNKPSFKEKVKSFIHDFLEGIKSLFKMKEVFQYIGLTFSIWICYVIMFWIPFFSLPEYSSLGADAVLSTFILGTIGFIVVQGGVGTYPVMVGIGITYFLNKTELIENGPMAEHIGFGTLIWATQTVLMVVLGLVSLFQANRLKPQE